MSKQKTKRTPALDPNVVAMGRRFKLAREALGLSQAAVSVRCGWRVQENGAEGQSRISQYERGEREPGITHILTLCKALNINPAEAAFGHPLSPDPDEEQVLAKMRTDPNIRRWLLRMVKPDADDAKSQVKKASFGNKR